MGVYSCFIDALCLQNVELWGRKLRHRLRNNCKARTVEAVAKGKLGTDLDAATLTMEDVVRNLF